MKEDILTLQEVAEYLKVNEKTVYRMVQSKKLPAFKVGNQWRFLKMDIIKWIESRNIVVEIPIVGKVAAGTPILAQENIEGTLTVDKTLVGQRNNVFALRVKGNSMIDADIKDGDFVVIQQQPQVNQGEIAVVLIDNEATVKKFYQEGDKIKLQPENESMPPIIIDPKEKEVSIIGKVKGVIRKM
ncbi:MAG: repressor LexA [Flavobacterium sp.]|nr:repressor LexA [Flavobacterium sp.]